MDDQSSNELQLFGLNMGIWMTLARCKSDEYLKRCVIFCCCLAPYSQTYHDLIHAFAQITLIVIQLGKHFVNVMTVVLSENMPDWTIAFCNRIPTLNQGLFHEDCMGPAIKSCTNTSYGYPTILIRPDHNFAHAATIVACAFIKS